MKERISKGSYEISSDCNGNLKSLIVDILQFVPEKRLTISQIESHSWVQSNQSVEFSKGSGLIDQIIHASSQGHCGNSKKSRLSPGIKLHKQHLKSMGNFLEIFKDNLVGQVGAGNRRVRQPILNMVTEQ
jgi:hypothetical protein